MSDDEIVGRVVSVRAFPVKSLDAGPLARAQVLTSGVRHDRGWAVIDQSGQVVTARQADVLRTVRADVHDGAPAVTIAGSAQPLTGAAADAGLSDLLGRPVTLQASADGFTKVAPVHLVSRQGIVRGADHDLHDEQCPCSVDAPRANLVLDLAGSELETSWIGATLRVGQAVLGISAAPRHCLGVYADVLVEGSVAEGDDAILTRS